MKYLVVGWSMLSMMENEPEYMIRDIAGSITARVWKSYMKGYSYSLPGCYQAGLPSMDAAKRSCKRQLISRGYEFVSKERADKLQLLL